MIGEFAALITAFVWSFGSLCFTSASRTMGALNVNRIRLVMGVIMLGITLFIAKGWLIQPGMTSENFMYLAISGLIGLVIGDSFLFSAMVIIGTRLSMLVYALSPAIAALFAWLYLGEILNLLSIIGIGITLAGVFWVTRERQHHSNGEEKKVSAKGVLYAFIGGSGQAIGIVFAKKGLGDMIDPLSGTFVRMLSAAVIIWVVSIVTRKFVPTLKALKNKRGMLFSLGGAFFGPFLGVWMSLVAVKNTEAGVAMAITSVVPVLVIPWVILFYKEKVSSRAVIGAMIAVIGVFILFLH